MNDKILKSIGFPIRMLNIIDIYACQQGLSRSAFVVRVMDEFIKKHNLEKLVDTKNNTLQEK